MVSYNLCSSLLALNTPHLGHCTQIWVPKAAQVQTPVNKAQTMPKKLRYITGLRGPPSTKMNVVRLDLDLGQTHQH